MNNNYFFIKPLAEELQTVLPGMELLACFTQNKDELIFGFAKGEQEFWIRSNLAQGLNLLSFPDAFQRARVNTVNLFPVTIRAVVERVSFSTQDRSFLVHLSKENEGVLEHFALIFKMHGNRSNVLLYSFESQKVVKVFRKNIQGDDAITPENLSKVYDLSLDRFSTLSGDMKVFLPTLGLLGQDIWRHHLLEARLEEGSLDRQFALFEDFYSDLCFPKVFYCVKIDKVPHISLFPIGDIVSVHYSAIACSNAFAILYAKYFFNDKEKVEATRLLDKRIKQTKQYIQKTERRIAELGEGPNPQQLADLIMANMHLISNGASSVTVEDFYNDMQLVKIKLNQKLSATENAANFYRKAKNRHQEELQLLENLTYREQQLKRFQFHEDRISTIENIRELRAYLKEHSLANFAVEEENLPYKEYLFMNFKIWVGRNAEQNDKLTLHFAHKNDLWLHARDVSGSHIILKHQAGKNFPAPVIEAAAQLAAWNSKNKSNSLCPVIVTPKKYIRKIKGTPAGAVRVEKEEQVVLVEPQIPKGAILND